MLKMRRKAAFSKRSGCVRPLAAGGYADAPAAAAMD
jgi:hypothetical protein